MKHPIGFQCPICKQYAAQPTQIKRLGKGWFRFEYGCGHQETTKLASLGSYEHTSTK